MGAATADGFELGDDLMTDEEEANEGKGGFDSQIMTILTIAGLGLCVCFIGLVIFCKKKAAITGYARKKKSTMIDMWSYGDKQKAAKNGPTHMAIASQSHLAQPSG